MHSRGLGYNLIQTQSILTGGFWEEQAKKGTLARSVHTSYKVIDTSSAKPYQSNQKYALLTINASQQQSELIGLYFLIMCLGSSCEKPEFLDGEVMVYNVQQELLGNNAFV